MKDFINGESISQTMYIYKVYYSIKEGASQSKLSDLEAYEDQKVSYREQLKKIDAVVSKLDVFDDRYEAKLTKFVKLGDDINKYLHDIDVKIAALSSNTLKASSNIPEVDTDAIVKSMYARLEAFTAGKQKA